MFKLDLEKAEKPKIKLPTSAGSLKKQESSKKKKNKKKQESSRKTSTSASLTVLKPLTVWISRNCGKFLKRWEYPTTLPASWETCVQVKKQQLELDMEPICCSMSSAKCCFLTCIQISQKAGQVVWYSHLLKNFPQFGLIHTAKGFSVVNEAKIKVFSGSLLLFLWFNACWQFDLWFLCLF